MEEAQNRQNNIGEISNGLKPAKKKAGLKKTLLIVFSVIFLLAAVLTPILVFTLGSKKGEDYKVDDYGDWRLLYNHNDKTYDIVRYLGNAEGGEVTIPATINGIKVNYILANAFNANENDNMKNVTKIKFAEGTEISGIGNNAFDSCTSLTEVKLPASVKSVGSYAFNNCSKLEKLVIENAYGFTFGKNALKGTDSLKTLEILGVYDNLGNVGSLGNIGSLDSNNNNLNLVLGNGVNGIGSGFVANGVTEISVFNYENLNVDASTLSSVKTLNIYIYGENNELTADFMNKFAAASNLTTVNIMSEGINKIGVNAFKGLTKLNKVTVFDKTAFDINMINASSDVEVIVKPQSASGDAFEITLFTTSGTSTVIEKTFIDNITLQDLTKRISVLNIDSSITGINGKAFDTVVFDLKKLNFVEKNGKLFTDDFVLTTTGDDVLFADNGEGLVVTGPARYASNIFKAFNTPRGRYVGGTAQGAFYARTSYNGKASLGAVILKVYQTDMKNGVISNTSFTEIQVPTNEFLYEGTEFAYVIDESSNTYTLNYSVAMNDAGTIVESENAIALSRVVDNRYAPKDVVVKTSTGVANFAGITLDGSKETYDVYFRYEADKTNVTVEIYGEKLDKTGYELQDSEIHAIVTEKGTKTEIDVLVTGFVLNVTKTLNEFENDYSSAGAGFMVYADGKLSIDGDPAVLSNGSVIKLYFTRETYIVTLMPNADNEDSVNIPSDITGDKLVDGKYTITYGENFDWLDDVTVTRPGYALLGWRYADGTKAEGNFQKTTNIELFAIWEAQDVSYKVEYWYENANDSEFTKNSEETLTAKAGDKVTPAFLAVTPEGFVQNIRSENVTINGNGTTVLTVKYIRSIYTINIFIDTNIGSTDIYYGDDVVFVAADKTVDQSKLTFTRKYQQNINILDLERVGYTFEGYYKGGNLFDTGATAQMPHEDGPLTLTVKWTAISSTVTLNANGGEGAPASIDVDFDGTYVGLTIPTKEGFTFNGWYDNAGFTGNVYTSATKVVKTTNHTLYAKYTVNTYTVTFDANGGTVTPTSGTVTFGQAYGTLPTPTRTGYIFTGWYLKDTTTKIIETTEVGTADNHTLVAEWEAVSGIVVTLNKNTTDDAVISAPQISVEFDEKYAGLETVTATRKGYKFSGWNTQANGEGVTVTKDTTVTNAAAHTLYAQWTAETYTVTLNANGGSNVVASFTVTFDEAYGDELTTPTKENYTFIGWYDNADFTGEVYTSDTIVKTDANHTLYAKYEGNKITVTLNANGGSVTPSTVERVFGDVYGTLPEASKPGYTFIEWNTLQNGSGDPIEPSTKVTTVTTLFAQYAEHSYNVVFTDGFGQDYTTLKKSDILYSATVTLPGAQTKDGFTFTGWKNRATGETLAANATTSMLTAANGATVTFDAQWDEHSYNVVFSDGLGQEYNDLKQTGVLYRQEVTLPAGKTRAGYEFTGWKNRATGENLAANAKTSMLTTANGGTVYFDAQWEAETYTVTFNAGEGTVDPTSKTVTFGEKYETLPTPTRTGYTFNAWKLNGNVITENSVVETAGDHALDADWVINSYWVTYVDTNDSSNTQNVKYNYNQTFNPITIERNGYSLQWKFVTGTTAYPAGTYEKTSTFVNLTTDNKAETEAFVFETIWTANTVNVTLNALEGEFAENVHEKTISATFDAEYVNIVNPTLYGYNFAGWYDNTSFTGNVYTVNTKVGEEALVEGGLTLYAKYEAKQIEVTLHPNNGADNSKITVAFDGTYLGLPASVTKENYTFVAWYDNTEFTGNKYTASTKVEKEEVTDLYAKLVANVIEVTLNADGGTVNPAKIYVQYNNVYGKYTTDANVLTMTAEEVEELFLALTVQELPVPTKTDNVFVNWRYSDNAVDKETTVGTATILTAVYDSTIVTLDVVVKYTDIADNGISTTAKSTTQAVRFGKKELTASDTQYIVTNDQLLGKINNPYNFDAYTIDIEDSYTINESGSTIEIEFVRDKFTVTITGFNNEEIGTINNMPYGANVEKLKSSEDYADIISSIEDDTYAYSTDLVGVHFSKWTIGGADITASTIVADNIEIKANYEENAYKVTLDKNDHSEADTNGQVVYEFVYSDTEKLNFTDTVFTCFGYNLTAWSYKTSTKDIIPANADVLILTLLTNAGTAQGEEDLYLAPNKEVQEITIRAIWEAKEVVVTLDKNTDDVTAVLNKDSITVTFDGTYESLATVTATRDGYTFEGWYFTVDADGKVQGEKVTSTTKVTKENHKLYANWTAEEYTITLNANGGKFEDESVEINNVVTFDTEYGFIEEPTRNGYTFAGWNTAADGEGEDVVFVATNTVEITADLKVYAQWTPNPYKVTLDAGEGFFDEDGDGEKDTNETNVKEITVTFDGTYGELPVPTLYGSTFNNWKLGASVITKDSKVETAGDHTLVADYTIISGIAVTLDPNGGTVNPTTTTVTFGEAYGALPTPTKAGNTFAGWKLDGETITAASIVEKAEAHTLVADWTAHTFTVKFEGVAAGETSEFTLTYGQANKVYAPNAAIITGKTFTGWLDSTNNITLNNGAELNNLTENDNVVFTFVPQYSANAVQVTLDANDGKFADDETTKVISVTFGGKYTTLVNPTRYGYTFAGWNTEENGEGDTVTTNTEVTNAAVHTLYAQWTIITGITVTLDPNGGTVTPTSITVTFGDEYGDLPTPTWYGRTFNGWKLDGETITADSIVEVAEAHTLVADWVIITGIKVSFGPDVDPSFKTVTFGEEYGALPTPTRYGYTFAGWKLNGKTITATSIVEVAEDHALSPDWTPITGIVVTLDPNGGTVTPTSITVTFGDEYGILPTPTYEGYTFIGWYLDDELITADSVVEKAEAHTLVARKSGIGYEVTFDPNGGEVSPTIDTVTFGSAYGALPVPTKDGYDFAGWYLGTTKVEETTVVATAGNHTLKAKWVGKVTALTIKSVADDNDLISKAGFNPLFNDSKVITIYVQYGREFGKYTTSLSSIPEDLLARDAYFAGLSVQELPIPTSNLEHTELCDLLTTEKNSHGENGQIYKDMIYGPDEFYTPTDFEYDATIEAEYSWAAGLGSLFMNSYEIDGFETDYSTAKPSTSSTSTWEYNIWNTTIQYYESTEYTFTINEGYFLVGVYVDKAFTQKINTNATIDGLTNKGVVNNVLTIGFDAFDDSLEIFYILVEKASVKVTLDAVDGEDASTWADSTWATDAKAAEQVFEYLTYTSHKITASMLPSATKTGYQFMYWAYADGTRFVEADIDAYEAETIELVAVYKELISVTIENKALSGYDQRIDNITNFVALDGVTINAVDGKFVGLVGQSFTVELSKPGYTFIGLYKDNVRVAYDSAEAATYTIQGTETLEARFLANKFVINIQSYIFDNGIYTKDAKGGNAIVEAVGGTTITLTHVGSNPREFEVYSDEQIRITQEYMIGYEYVGFYKGFIVDGSSTAGEAYTLTGVETFNASAAYSAEGMENDETSIRYISVVFEKASYGLAFDAKLPQREQDGGVTVQTPAPITPVKDGDVIDFTALVVNGTPTYYTFIGWSFVDGSTTVDILDGEQDFVFDASMVEYAGPDGVITLYGVWAPVAIKVTVNGESTTYASNSQFQEAINFAAAIEGTDNVYIELFGEYDEEGNFNNVFELTAIAKFNSPVVIVSAAAEIYADGQVIIKRADSYSGYMFELTKALHFDPNIVLDGNGKSTAIIYDAVGGLTLDGTVVQNGNGVAVDTKSDITNATFQNNAGIVVEVLASDVTLGGAFINNNAGSAEDAKLIASTFGVELKDVIFYDNSGYIFYNEDIENYGDVYLTNAVVANHENFGLRGVMERITLEDVEVYNSSLAAIDAAVAVTLQGKIWIDDSNSGTLRIAQSGTPTFNVDEGSYISNAQNGGYGVFVGTLPDFGTLTFTSPNLDVQWNDTLTNVNVDTLYAAGMTIGDGAIIENLYSEGGVTITGNAKVYNVYGEVTFDSLFNVNESPYINIHSDKMDQVAFHYGNIDIANALLPKLNLVHDDTTAFIANVRTHAWIANGPFAEVNFTENVTNTGYSWVDGELTWTSVGTDTPGTFVSLAGVDMSASGWWNGIFNETGTHTIVINSDSVIELQDCGSNSLFFVAGGSTLEDPVELEINGLNGKYFSVGITGSSIHMDYAGGLITVGYNVTVSDISAGYGTYYGGSLYYADAKENPLFTLQGRLLDSTSGSDILLDSFTIVGGIIDANIDPGTGIRIYGDAIINGNITYPYDMGTGVELSDGAVINGNIITAVPVKIDNNWYGSIEGIVIDGAVAGSTVFVTGSEQDIVNARAYINGDYVSLKKVPDTNNFVAWDKDYAAIANGVAYETLNEGILSVVNGASDKTIHLMRDITASDITALINNKEITIDAHNNTIDLTGDSNFKAVTIKNATIVGGLAGDTDLVIDGDVNYTGATAQMAGKLTVNGTLNVFGNTFSGYIFAPSVLAGTGVVNVYDNNSDGALISEGSVAKLNVYGNSGNGIEITDKVTALENVVIANNGGNGLVIGALDATNIEINDIVISNNGGYGAIVKAGANGLAHVVMNNVSITGSENDGIFFEDAGEMQDRKFVINSGVITNNGGNAISVNENYELTLNGAVVASYNDNYGVEISSGKVNLTAGEIANSANGVYVANGATFVMTAGTIANCGDTGVYVDGGATFLMNGGVIARCAGHGVYVVTNGNFDMTGGEISNISPTAVTFSTETATAVEVFGTANLLGGMISNSNVGINYNENSVITMDDAFVVNACTKGLVSKVNNSVLNLNGSFTNCESGVYLVDINVAINGGIFKNCTTGINFDAVSTTYRGQYFDVDINNVLIKNCETGLLLNSGYWDYATAQLVTNDLTIKDCATGIKFCAASNDSGKGNCYFNNTTISGCETGLLLQSDCRVIRVDGVIVENCTYGITEPGWVGGAQYYNIEISDCDYGIYNIDDNPITIENSVIKNCKIVALDGGSVTVNEGTIITADKAVSGSVAISSGTVTINGGTISNYETGVKATTVTMTSGEINGIYTYNAISAEECTFGGNAKIVDVTSAITGDTAISGGVKGAKTVTMTGGTIDGVAFSARCETFNMTAGTITGVKSGIWAENITIDGENSNIDASDYALYPFETCTVNNGKLKASSTAILVDKNSTCEITIKGGEIYDSQVGIGAYSDTIVHNATINIENGTIKGCTTGINSSNGTFNMTAGTINNCTTGVKGSLAKIYGGTITNCTTGIEVTDIEAINDTTLTNNETAIKASGIAASTNLTITNTVASDATPTNTGIVATNGTFHFESLQISNCVVGIECDESSSLSDFIDSSISNCVVGVVLQQSPYFTNVTFTDNFTAIKTMNNYVTVSGFVITNSVATDATPTNTGILVESGELGFDGGEIKNCAVGIEGKTGTRMNLGSDIAYCIYGVKTIGSACLLGGTISDCGTAILAEGSVTASGGKITNALATGVAPTNIGIMLSDSATISIDGCEIENCAIAASAKNGVIEVTYDSMIENCGIGFTSDNVITMSTGTILNCNKGITGDATVTISGSSPRIYNTTTRGEVGVESASKKITINLDAEPENTTIENFTIGVKGKDIEFNTAKINNCTTGIYNVNTLTMTGGSITGFTEYGIYSERGTVTISDGTIKNTTLVGVGIQAPDLTMTGGTIENVLTGVKSNGVISAGTISKCQIGVLGMDTAGSLIKMTGGTIVDCQTGMQSNGSVLSVELAGGEITTDAEYTIVDGTVGINNGNMTGGNISYVEKGVIVKSNDVTINRGNIFMCKQGVYGTSVNGNVTMSTAIFDCTNGGVYLQGTGTLTTTSLISANAKTDTDKLGAGIYVDGLTVIMNDGEIHSHNVDTKRAINGGAVYIASGTFIMNGGDIDGNYVTGCGGAIYVDKGTFIMNGGRIWGNGAATYGGAVYISSNAVAITHNGKTAAVHLLGGEIENNTLTDQTTRKGAGLYVDGSVYMDGTIVLNHNAAGGKAFYGAGAYVTANGSFVMDGGAFLNNYAITSGGGAYVVKDGSFTMNGGTVSDCGIAESSAVIDNQSYWTIKFDNVDDENASIMVNQANTTTALPVNQYVRDGYVFDGWTYVDADGTIKKITVENLEDPTFLFTYSEDMVTNGAITLTAVWNEVSE